METVLTVNGQTLTDPIETTVAPVPEPGTATLVTLGLIALVGSEAAWPSRFRP